MVGGGSLLIIFCLFFTFLINYLFFKSYIINLILSISCTLLLIIKLHEELNCLITFYDHLKTISKNHTKYKNIIFKEQEGTFIDFINSIFDFINSIFDFINNNKKFVFIKKTLNLNYIGGLNLNHHPEMNFHSG